MVHPRHRLLRPVLVLLGVLGLAWNAPAPLIYRPGEGWIYVPYDQAEEGGAWTRDRAEDQLEVAQQAFAEEDYNTAFKAARRLVARWPLSDYAPEAQYLVGRSQEERGRLERAFDAYQKVVEDYPKSPRYEEILDRQYQIANRYLDGRWFRLWGFLPAFPSMEKTVKLYDQIIKNGPYSDVAPDAQMNIGTAREKQHDYDLAVRAYIRAADRYYDQQAVAADAVYRAALAYNEQAKTAEYDQSQAGLAIDWYTDFMTLYPADARVAEARQAIKELREEQARGAHQTARYYEKQRNWRAAMIYYNEVILKDPESRYAEEARRRIEQLNARLDTAAPATAE